MNLRPGLPCTVFAGLLLAAAPVRAAPADALAADPLAQAVLVAINHYRHQAGLPAWVADDALSSIAADHSQAQAAQGRLSHGGFQQRFAQARAQVCVENLAAGHGSGQAVVDAWRASPQHQLNLLDPDVDRVGLASSGAVVSMLACRFSSARPGQTRVR